MDEYYPSRNVGISVPSRRNGCTCFGAKLLVFSKTGKGNSED